MEDFSAQQVLVAGGGIGGLAAALACARQGLTVQLLERSPQLSEAGAGIQMGPNVTRVLQAWGLGGALAQVAAFPKRLQARDAHTGQVLGSLRLGARAQALYGGPYATVHRADLHALLYSAVQAAGVQVQWGQTVQGWHERADGVHVDTATGDPCRADALIGADGVWSAVRQQLLGDAPAPFSGHLAYRALMAQADLPAHLRTDEITVWMGPRLHVVHYPVRGGQWLNWVAIVPSDQALQAQAWDEAGSTPALMQAMGVVGPDLQERLACVPAWRQWAVHERAPVSAAHQMAQGAGMAIEDAQVLAQCLAHGMGSTAQRLQAYAQQRWARNAQVQRRALRNGRIFHAQGLVAAGRNLSLRLMGERLMDVPWLYGGGPAL